MKPQPLGCLVLCICRLGVVIACRMANRLPHLHTTSTVNHAPTDTCPKDTALHADEDAKAVFSEGAYPMRGVIALCHSAKEGVSMHDGYVRARSCLCISLGVALPPASCMDLNQGARSSLILRKSRGPCTAACTRTSPTNCLHSSSWYGTKSEERGSVRVSACACAYVSVSVSVYLCCLIACLLAGWLCEARFVCLHVFRPIDLVVFAFSVTRCPRSRVPCFYTLLTFLDLRSRARVCVYVAFSPRRCSSPVL